MQYGVVVLSYNHIEITRACVRSLLNTLLHPNIFLIHNGSRAENIELLKKEFPTIRHEVLSENRGYSGGANFGLRCAFAEFEHVLFLTNDTEVLRIADPPKIQPAITSVTCMRRKTEIVDSIVGLVDVNSAELRHARTTADIESRSKNQLLYIPGTAFWIDRVAFNALNGFDESYHTYWEDVDLSYRALKSGINLAYDTNTVVRHKIGKTCHKDSFYSFYLFNRNRRRFMRQHQLSHFWFEIKFFLQTLKRARYRWPRALEVFRS